MPMLGFHCCGLSFEVLNCKPFCTELRRKLEMASKLLQNILFGGNHLRRRAINGMRTGLVHFHYSDSEELSEEEENIPPLEWCEMAFLKLKKWSHMLKELDLIGGRLVTIEDHSRVFDDKMEHKLHTFKSIARVFVGLPTMKETIRKNLMALSADWKCTEFQYFTKKHEREALSVNSLINVSNVFGISSQQKKVVRQAVGRQVTHTKIWNETLVEILNGLKSEIEVLIHTRPSKEIRLAQQIIICYLKFLESAISYDPETSSWMHLTPTKAAHSVDSTKWGDALEMSIDLVKCLSEEKGLAFHISKLERMKEGLYHIRDILADKNIGYKENRFQEHLVQKKLREALGFSSRCLFTLLLYYLYGTAREIEVDLRGGFQSFDGGTKFCLYMGKILTLDDEKVVLNGLRELHRALGLFKFVWDTAGSKGDLVLQGHLWCVGAQHRSLEYRGNTYYLHGIHL